MAASCCRVEMEVLFGDEELVWQVSYPSIDIMPVFLYDLRVDKSTKSMSMEQMVMTNEGTKQGGTRGTRARVRLFWPTALQDSRDLTHLLFCSKVSERS